MRIGTWNVRSIEQGKTGYCEKIDADLPTMYEIKPEDLPPFEKKNAEDFYAGKKRYFICR